MCFAYEFMSLACFMGEVNQDGVRNLVAASAEVCSNRETQSLHVAPRAEKYPNQKNHP